MYYIICSTLLRRSVKLFHQLKVHHKERAREGGVRRKSTLQDPTQHMEWIDFRNLHLLPGPLRRSNNVPQNMVDG